jgi:1-acyl-sn-glycerol-3-phosphate acyltransferase
VRHDVAWARSGLACAVREVILSAVFRPLIAIYARRTVTGTEHLDGLDGPVILVANHSSHMDTPLLLRALPWRWRRRTAVAAAADYFYTRRWLARAVSLAFNTVPVARKGENVDPRLFDRLLDERWSLLLFAEGTRSRDGKVGKLRTGAAVLAAEHELPIVPIYVRGTHEAMPVGRGWVTRHPEGGRHDVGVAIGPPIRPRAGEHRRDVMERVREFLESQGASTTPAPRAPAEGTPTA